MHTPQIADRALWEQRAQRRVGYAEGAQLDTPALLQRNLCITEAYAELYLRRPDVYKWAGLAALTSATVGRGMYLMLALRYSGLSGLAGLFGRDTATIFGQLIEGNWQVFCDIYWQHLAYEQAGLAGLEQIHAEGGLCDAALGAWRQIEAGRQKGQPERIWAGNTMLLRFEQERVLQPGVYDGCEDLWQQIAGWVPSPVPGHLETFADFSPHGNIGVFEQRWRWITKAMLPRWRRLSDASPERVQRALMGCMRLSAWVAMWREGINPLWPLALR
jgi:hypothetical protein